MSSIEESISPDSVVYGVVLNDIVSLKAIGNLDEVPYKGAPRAPVMYIKPAGTRVADGAVVSLPGDAAEVEVGATVGLVLGRSIARASVEDALEAVSGLVLAADLSLPHASYYRPAIREKCFDGALPVSAIQPVCDLSRVELAVAIDGRPVDGWSMASLVRDPATLLANVSEFMTLRAGDVLLVGVRYNAPRAARGSHVRIMANGLGSLAFSIEGEAR
jgi:5-oxopent-3-ene-1,2,5-tricarboxylate decarboxylase/2-hydroxyhepta-2,4-diene-1,7-dioate isomerase